MQILHTPQFIVSAEHYGRLYRIVLYPIRIGTGGLEFTKPTESLSFLDLICYHIDQEVLFGFHQSCKIN